MVTFAKEEMVPQLKRIWKECFGDTDAYINFYFDNRFRAEDTLVWSEGKQPVSMLGMLPASIWVNGSKEPVYYIYGVGTLAGYRNRGIAGRLLQYAGRELNRSSILVPADRILFPYYEKYGYRPLFPICEERLVLVHGLSVRKTVNPEKDFQVITADALEYKKIRDSRFCRDGYVEWEKSAVAYAIEECRLSGGEAYLILIEGRVEILLYCMNGRELYIKETTLNGRNLNKVIRWLAGKTGYDTIITRTPAENENCGGIREFGMASGNVQLKSGYLNLVLD